MELVFRTDANKSIGMGHIMRCLSIADSFRKEDCVIRFLIADECVQQLIRARGYETIVLHSDYKRLDEEKWPKGIEPNLVIVDSYYVTAEYLRRIREKLERMGGKLVYLDDIYSFPYPVDILVNYNVYANRSIYDSVYVDVIDVKPQMIIGPSYVPLRSMFRGIESKVQPQKVKNVLISTGGADEFHLTISLIRHLHQMDSVKLDCVYHFLVGGLNSDTTEIKKYAAESDNVVIHENVTDMKTLIQNADLVVSAAGSTLYEVSACGVPLITYVIADNQINGADSFEYFGMAVNVGDLRTIEMNRSVTAKAVTLATDAVERIMSAVDELSLDYERRVLMGKKMQDMIDGTGADKLVQRIKEMM